MPGGAGNAAGNVASLGGAPKDPNWAGNLRANPEATVRVDGDAQRFGVAEGVPQGGGDGHRLWRRQVLGMAFEQRLRFPAIEPEASRHESFLPGNRRCASHRSVTGEELGYLRRALEEGLLIQRSGREAGRGIDRMPVSSR